MLDIRCLTVAVRVAGSAGDWQGPFWDGERHVLLCTAAALLERHSAVQL